LSDLSCDLQLFVGLDFSVGLLLTGFGFHDFLAGCSVRTIEQSCKPLQIQGLAVKVALQLCFEESWNQQFV